jgi:hypothetical protein
MTDYYVEWSIDLEASSPREAAEMALAIMRDPTSIATVFRIYDEDGNPVQIDLQEEEQPK